ncbi:hypothetical protein ACFE04_006691 [Oxalis oulophora]
MNWQNGNQNATHSSITLLQERFRQLQKAKEMRQEREILKLYYAKSEQFNSTYHRFEPFFHSELIIPPCQNLQGSHCSQHSKISKHGDHQVTQTPILANLWSANSVTQRMNNFDDSDVDTSLHL